MTDPFGFSSGSVLHFIGIGGIGMSALAMAAHDCGYTVQGSDTSTSLMVQTLLDRGIQVMPDHRTDNAHNADVVIYSNAIKSNNVELQSAIAAGKLVLRRTELLSKALGAKRTIVVSGSHGKTSTTGMLASIMEHAGMDPTVFIGGVALSYGNNYKMGTGEWAVVEGDESDAGFTELPCEIAVVTNLEWEHPDRYSCLEALERVFSNFLCNVKVGGAAVIPSRPSFMLGNSVRCSKITYGLEGGELLVSNTTYMGNATVFDIVGLNGAEVCRGVQLPVLGYHNVENALAAAAVAKHIGIGCSHIKAGLEGFMGVSRRFEIIANVRGVTFVDDYAHHPTEIEASRNAAKIFATSGRVIGILQPHRFTRVQHFFKDFASAISKFDYLILTDVYPAGEEVISGCESQDIVREVKSLGFDQVVHASTPDTIANIVASVAGPGDVVVAMGAGSITSMIRSISNAYMAQRSVRC
ncbi:MAG: UDP-N-acetylmuramate--L-alanine ligase [Anaplasma ovis]|uniref:UDP-N-acetylmuramate--L-alanine ligase n=1 Tax=Anaplasma ovis str. Haibei TaxID=1248439 RepID=A0A2Z2LC77_9RICK|nr:UDP-N-acetylmuramate--L-alanine ligase [Anaplasma ovis str. Haibei]